MLLDRDYPCADVVVILNHHGRDAPPSFSYHSGPYHHLIIAIHGVSFLQVAESAFATQTLLGWLKAGLQPSSSLIEARPAYSTWELVWSQSSELSPPPMELLSIQAEIPLKNQRPPFRQGKGRLQFPISLFLVKAKVAFKACFIAAKVKVAFKARWVLYFEGASPSTLKPRGRRLFALVITALFCHPTGPCSFGWVSFSLKPLTKPLQSFRTMFFFQLVFLWRRTTSSILWSADAFCSWRSHWF